MRKRSRARRSRSWISTLWRQHLTAAGKALLGLLLVSLPGLTVTDSGLLVLMAAIISSFMIAIAVGWIFRPRVDLIGQPVARIMRGDPTSIVCQLRNARRFPGFGLQLRWIKVPEHWGHQDEFAVLPRLVPGASLRLSMPITAQRRGVSAWPVLEIASTYPLNLVRFRQTFQLPGTVSVYPRYHRLRSVEPIAGATSHGDHEAVEPRPTGQSGEYMGNREYQVGLAVRRWDFGSWARLGRPIVREYAEPERREVAVIIDSFIDLASDAPLPEDFEQALALAASVCESLQSIGCRIPWLSIGAEHLDLSSRSTAAEMPVILDRLAAALPQPTSARKTWSESLRSRLRAGLPVVMIVARWDDAGRQMIRELRRTGISLTVLKPRHGAVGDAELPGYVRPVAINEFAEQPALVS